MITQYYIVTIIVRFEGLFSSFYNLKLITHKLIINND